MKKIEMHCHSTLSDGRNAPEQIIAEAKRRNLDFLALTDHDAIAPRYFQEALKNEGIETCDSVEISAQNPDLGKSLHLVSYAKIFHKSLHDILDLTRTGKVKMYDGQIHKLSGYGFEGDIQGFEDYMQKKHNRGLRSANKWFLSHYLFRIAGNKEKMSCILRDLLGDSNDMVGTFYSECLKREGSLYDKYGYESEEYEPSVEQTIEGVVHKSGGIVSMAHPNVTFGGNKGGIPEFERTIGDYVGKGVRGVEINTMASTEWVQAILKTRQKYDLILTFGSDCHQIGYDGRDGKHSTIGVSNPYVSDNMIDENFGIFQKLL